jgi:hypothetical protein
MPRTPLLASLLVAAAFAALPAGAGARVTYKVGISDQSAATFVNPLFAPLRTGMARYVTPWDVMNPGRVADRNSLVNWIDHARAAHQRILVAFETSHTPGQQRKAPGVARYTQAIRRFHKAFPDVKDIQAWNEVNRCQSTDPSTGYVVGQPICKKPKLAAAYYMAARRVFKGAKITGLDILDAANIKCHQMYCALRYVRTFMKYAKPRPRYWGIHNYADTNRFSNKRTRALLKATKSGDVWLTETGGIVSLGKNFPYNQKRAAKALGCMFTLAKSNRRIKRLYVYQFNGIPRGRLFDAGLLNPDNTKRPGYNVVLKRRARPCHR